MEAPQIAILDGNALSLLGMKTLLERIVPPQAEVLCFSQFAELEKADACFFHYFISSQSLIEHTAYFLERSRKVIVLVNGTGILPNGCDFHTLDISRGEDALVRDLLRLMSHAHQHGHNLPPRTRPEEPCGLTQREVEVLGLIVRGFINKEIADHLHISLTTVISHRKSIMEKTRVRSVAGLTIYAVVNGYVDVSEI